MDAVLGIDTSCYTTSLALAWDGSVLDARRRLLQVPLGQRGLRQNEAVFQHIRQLPVLMEDMMRGTDAVLSAICVSASPVDHEDSYMPVFQAGLSYARFLGSALRIPVMFTTHQRGHVRAALQHAGMESGKPFLCAHLSGGTTDVFLVDAGKITLLGTSKDLHAGQLVDRIAVRLGFPFPGGPSLETLCEGVIGQGMVPVSISGCDCHLSGAEAFLMRMAEQGADKAEIARETYSLLVRTVYRMLEAAAQTTGVRDVLLMGGIASSAMIRKYLDLRVRKRGAELKLYFGRPEYSGDNACGVALIGDEKRRGTGWLL